MEWIFLGFIVVFGTATAVCMFIGVRDNFREELHFKFRSDLTQWPEP